MMIADRQSRMLCLPTCARPAMRNTTRAYRAGVSQTNVASGATAVVSNANRRMEIETADTPNNILRYLKTAGANTETVLHGGPGDKSAILRMPATESCQPSPPDEDCFPADGVRVR